MILKKINPLLQKALVENGFDHANTLQIETYSAVKSGADCVIAADAGSGKTTMLVLNIIQKLEGPEGESTRALVMVESKEKMLAVKELFDRLSQHSRLRIYGTSDKSDLDNDKNQISLGTDILIGTPAKLNALFSGAGFNMKTIRIFAIDDADLILRARHEAVVNRLSDSVTKTQRLITTTLMTEKVSATADRIMTDPKYFDFT